MSMYPGTEVLFVPDKGSKRHGVIAPGFVDTGFLKVHLNGDPFPVDLKADQIFLSSDEKDVVSDNKKVPKSGAKSKKSKEKRMASATANEAKELRLRAQALGLIDWEDLGRKELRKAVERAEAEQVENGQHVEAKPKKAKKSKAAKKAKTEAKEVSKASKKAKKEVPEGSDEALGLSFARGSTAKDLPAEGENPFRKGSNLNTIAKLLLKGGTRRALAQQLADKVTLHPYQKAADSVDLGDYDKRIILAAQTMRDQYGYGVQRQGRGLDGKVKVFRPGGAGDPRNKTSK